jgi:DNA-binding NtrC family response regulator
VLPLGAAQPVAVDARIIAATRKDLASEVVAGRFREDLYYRLNVLTVTLPPLRARKGDLPVLCAALLRELRPGVDFGPIEGPNLARLESHRWPGNVRELRNVLERAVVRGARTFAELEVQPEAAPPAPGPAAPADGSFQEQRQHALGEFERSYLVNLLKEHAGNIKAASRASGIERTQLKRLMRKHGLR